MADPVQLLESGGGEGAPKPVAVDAVPAATEPNQDSSVPVSKVTPEEVSQQTEKDDKNLKEEIKEASLEVKKDIPAEVKEVVVEVKNETPIEATNEVKSVEEKKEAEPVLSEASVQNKLEPAMNSVEAPKENSDWQQKEMVLLKKIEELEKVKNERSVDGIKLELKMREEEIDLLKARIRNLETELQAALSKPSGKNHEMIENIKQQHEELLSKARGMIFDKTKMVKNQELQIEALTTQVQSLKDINQITKDLLEIRNSEVQAMEERFQAMDARFKAEKERHGLVIQRAQTSSTLNDDLRKEYETQLAIFKELREKYELRVQALVSENERLKESLKSGSSG